MKFEEMTEFIYNGNTYKINREGIIRELTWPFRYKTKLLSSNKFFINVAFGKTAWTKPAFKVSLDVLTEKYGFILGGDLSDIEKIQTLNDIELVNFLHEITEVALKSGRKTNINRIWVYNKCAKKYIEFQKIIPI